MSGETKKEDQPKKRTTKTKPSLPKGLQFEFGEIKIAVEAVKDGEHLSEIYKGKLLKTDLPSACKAFDKLRAKYK